MKTREFVLSALCLVLSACAVGAMAAVEPLRDRTAIQIADSRTAWLDVRTNKVYQFEDTIPVSHSAGNWANQPASPTAKARVMWQAADESKSGAGSYTDDVPLTMTLNEPGQYDIIHVAKDGTLSSNAFTVVKRQLGTEDEPWIVSEEGKDEVRAFMRSETELCIEGDGETMAKFGGCGPWGDKVESVYFANTNQQISAGAFDGCKNLRVVMTKGNTDALKDQLKKSGFNSKVVGINLDDLKTTGKVKMFDFAVVNGRAKVFCVVYDDEAASKDYGSNLKLKADLRGTEKAVKHLHRLESGGVERDDMMLWQKDDRPQFVTLIWDALLDVTAAEFSDLGLSVTATPCDDTTVKVANGNFVGVLDGGTKVRTWKGIPYAKQPTGGDRWKAMGDPTASTDTFAAKQFGHAAIQRLDPGETGGYIEQGDDCLVLNVWSTDEKADVGCEYGKRPVMVYLHGGAFVLGGSADIHYDGRNIVERNKDVVVVTINYRVGLLGFADLKNVPGSEKDEGFRNTAKLAILDQRQALIWVQNNIAAFGGDPENVTIFGESAGGTGVAIHMTSPESKDLFKRAIQMSGALDLTLTEKSYDDRRLVPELVAAVAKLRFGDVSKTNYVDMTLLQSLTADEIRNLMLTVADAQKTDKDELSWPAWDLPTDDITGGECILNSFLNFPICDDVRGSVPTDPFKAFKESGVANGKDYMVGTVRNEMRYFMGYDGPDDPLHNYYTGFLADRMNLNKVWLGKENEHLIHDFIDAYEDDGVRDEMDTRYPGIWKRTALEDQLYMRLPAIKMAEIHAKLSADPESGKKGKTYMYRFDKGREYANQPWAKAGHACELDYAFGNTSIAEYGPINEDLANAVNSAFVNFARCGNPNGEGNVGGETWDEYDTTARKTMLFQSDCTTSLAEDPEQVARKMFLDSGAYDTYHEARADTERRTKIDVPFVRDEDAVPDGDADEYWQVGKTAGDTVIAFTDDTGKLFVEGTGKIRDFYAIGGGLWFNETTTEAEFGPGVTGIGSNMLSNCILLRTIALYPAIPPTLGKDALPDDDDLDAIYVQEEYYEAYTNAWSQYQKVIKGVKLGCKELPWKVGLTATDTAAACTNGTERLEIIGEGVMTGFDKSAPWASGDLTEAVIGAGVTAIGKNCLADCAGLKTLVIYAAKPPALGEGNDLAGVKIFVPAGAADDYRAAWPDCADAIDEMRSAKGEELTKHLYEMTYNWWDATKANDIGEMLAELTSGPEQEEANGTSVPHAIPAWFGELQGALCTSCRNGNFVGRNFDWGYDDVDECVMHIPAAEGRLASIGVVSWFFPEDLQKLFDVDSFLPELTMDGVNEKGVAINVNVVPGGDNGWTTGTNSNATRRLCAGFAVRTVLDNATNAAHAVEILESRDIYSLKPLEFHWMISDATESYVVECVSNALVVLKAKEARPKMSNYYVTHSPSVGEYQVLTNAELTATEHTPHAMGIERYANVSNGLEFVDSVEAMYTQMTNVWYKPKYLPGNEKKYWSDLNGAPVPGKDGERFAFGDEEKEGYEALRYKAFKQIQANYEEVLEYEQVYGIRDTLKNDPMLTNGVVHTVHTSIYDIEKRRLCVVVQEDATYARDVYLTPGAEYSPWEVGGDDTDPTKVVGAWTNGTELVIEGSGTVTNLTAIPSAVKSGLTAITIKAGVTGAAPLVFAGVKDFALTLPDGWQGELPDDKGNWYGATGVELTGGTPFAVKNVTSQQRYPWNGLVDITCGLTGSGTVTLSATVLTNGVVFIEAKTLIGETTIDLDAVGGETNGVKFIWNAAADLPAGFKAGVQVKVTLEK